MVKCAAFNCRSGYRPTKQEEEMTARGETPPCKKHVFAFPKKAEIRTQWIAAIHREDSGLNPDHSGVCELHFKPQDFALGVAPRTKTERQRLRLKADAIPSIFNNYLETARPKVVEEQQTSQASSSACRYGLKMKSMEPVHKFDLDQEHCKKQVEEIYIQNPNNSFSTDIKNLSIKEEPVEEVFVKEEPVEEVFVKEEAVEVFVKEEPVEEVFVKEEPYFYDERTNKEVQQPEIPLPSVNQASPFVLMEWTKEETIRFIETYHRRDLIWDPKHPDHYNKLQKQDAWKEIAKEMGNSVDECKKKMEYLLSALRREKMKMKKSTGTGKGAHEVYKSSWFAFDSMRFVWDKNKPRPTLSTTATSEQIDSPAEAPLQGEGLNTSLAISQEGNPGPNTSNTECPQPQTPKRKKLKTSGDQRLDKAFEMLTAAANQINDESYHFGNLVASKLRTYDANVRCAIESDILNLFLMANRGYYNNVKSFPAHGFVGRHTFNPGSPPNYYSPTFSESSHSSENLGPCSTATPPAQAQPSPSPNNSTFSDDFSIQDLM